jgi:probable rRNA maturation factor
MITTIYNTQKDLPLSLASIRLMIPFLLEHLEISTDEVVLHFVSQKAIERLHDEFFSDPSPTDCISFPIDTPQKTASKLKHHVLGEVFVCPKVALQYAKEHSLDPYEETKLYVIHGILHLIGYDDLTYLDRRTMRKMEEKCRHLCKPFSFAKKRLS